MSSVFMHLDEAVERIVRLREDLLREADTPSRTERLAAVFESEARAWSQLYELSSLRLVWRAALAAEAGARANAALWARRAAQEQQTGGALVGSWAAGRVGAPRPAALTTSSTGGGR
jgi:hypothetical protein